MLEHWKQELPVKGIQKITPVSGGDVNDAYRIDTDGEPCFLLVQKGRAEDFYAAEIAGLKAMAEAGITAPKVLGNGQIEGDAFLLLEYLDEGAGSQWDLGQMVQRCTLNIRRMTNSVFIYRMKAETSVSIMLGRIPGGSCSSMKGWISCGIV